MEVGAKYAAFISYAHADEPMARRIHNALETYRLPNAFDQDAKEKLKPIFRDVTELTAHHSLSEKIQDAVRTSRFLIILCSPSAKNSHWVNEEIRLFRKLHGENKILSVIIDGNPETSFPKALIEGGREPLAANMTSREGFRFGITQLAASMIGVGLDELIQRDNKRRRRRLQWITTGALTFAGMMSVLTWTAFDARQEAETSRNKAETSRNEAEKLVEFLITDLKNELQTLGRTSILNDLGKRITEYYDAIPLSDMDRDRLARQAETRHLLGQVALDQGDLARAESEILAAYKVTEEILRRNPHDTDAIFDHAQSAYFIGLFHHKTKDFISALEYWEIYRQYAYALKNFDPENVKWTMEVGWSEGNVGNIYLNTKEYTNSKRHFESSVNAFEDVLRVSPQEPGIMPALANSLSGLSKSSDKIGQLSAAFKYRTKELKILDELVRTNPNNFSYAYERMISSLDLHLLNIKAKKSECSIVESEVKLDGFTQHLKRDPENEEYRNDYTHFRYWLFYYCHTIYNEDYKLKETNQLLAKIEKSTLSDKTQLLDFVDQILLEQSD